MSPRSRRASPCVSLLLLAGVAAPASHAQGGTTTSSGTLDAVGVALDNGVVRFHFHQAPATGVVELDVTDVAAPHTFSHGGAGLWGIELLDTQNPGYGQASIAGLVPSDCSSSVAWVLTIGPGLRTLTLSWTACTKAQLGSDSLDVDLRLELADASPTADWILTASSSMSRWSFWSGRIRLSLAEAPGITHWFLDPIGYLTEDPAANLPTWSLGTPQAQTGVVGIFKSPILHIVSQLAAYYDEAGNGLYLAGADPSGFRAKTYFFKRVPSQAGQPPRLDYACAHYAGDVLSPASDFEGTRMRIGVFRGDWYDAADRYRTWLEASTMGVKGPIATRPDVASSTKDAQQIFVLSPHENLGPVGTETASVPQRILEYGNHHGLSELLCVVFGNSWSVGDACGIGEYAFDDSAGSPWPGNVSLMQAAGIPLFLYLLDVAYALDPFGPSSGMCTGACTLNDTYWSQGWSQETIQRLDGSPLQYGDCTSLYPPVRLIDGTTTDWQRRMASVGFELASLGVSGVYVDNVLPGYFEGCYSAGHPHTPGLGTAHVQGLAKALAAVHAGGMLAGGAFDVGTEGGQYEAYIPGTGQIGGEAAFGDFLGGLQTTRQVPASSVSYHHLALAGVARCDIPFLVIPAVLPELSLPQKDNVWLADPLEAERGRRGALHAAAYAIVNGSPLWVPDQAQNAPKAGTFSFETTLPQAAIYQACIDYAAKGARYRGATSAQPYLNVGERLRDLVFDDPLPEIVVPLPILPYGASPDDNPAQQKAVPALLHSVWRDVQTGDVGLCLANHSGGPLSGLGFPFDPAAVGLSSTTPYQVYLVTPAQPDQLVLTATGTVQVSLPTQPAESFAFYRIAQP